MKWYAKKSIRLLMPTSTPPLLTPKELEEWKSKYEVEKCLLRDLEKKFQMDIQQTISREVLNIVDA